MSKLNKHNYNNLLSVPIFLLFFVAVNHLLVMLTFLSSKDILPLVLPISLIAALVIQYFLIRDELSLRKIFNYLFASLFLIFISTALALFYFDFSWDGQWYHQAAIYALEDGWNPLKNSLQTFEGHNDNSIRHFPKNSWYYATAFYSMSGLLEGGKSINFILFFAALIIAYVTAQEYKISRPYSFLISIAVCLNPVVSSEITTYLVDGNLYLLLIIYFSAVLLLFSNYRSIGIYAGSLAIIFLCNSKFTGLAFLFIFALFIFIYIVIYKKEFIFKFILVHVVVTILGVVVFGYNPYVTNTIERDQPFYPIVGSAKFPTELDNGFDGNEALETPKNMQGKSLLSRLYYAHFSRPGNAPYTEQNAILSFPFKLNVNDWKAYHFHETRLAGFGPLYSGILLLSALILLAILIKDKSVRWFCLLFYAAIFIGLALSKHFWWPRFAPQMWLIPIVPLLLSIRYCNLYRFQNFANKFLLFVILINAVIVFFVHMKWETESSITLHAQLNSLKNNHHPIKVSWEYFKTATEEKLKKHKINYISVPTDTIMKRPHKELKSVVEGYPGPILYSDE